MSFIIGCCFFSTLYLIAERIPQNKKIFLSRSCCTRCNKYLNWYELIPIISQLIQLNRCRHCKCRLSLSMPVFELLGGLLTYYWFNGYSVHRPVTYYVLLLLLLTLSISDILYFLIPDIVLFFGTSITLCIAFWEQQKIYLIVPVIFFLLTKLFYKNIDKYIGLGDFSIFNCLLFFTSVYNCLLILLIASLTGILYLIVICLLSHSNLKQPIPFVPFITFGYVLVYFLN